MKSIHLVLASSILAFSACSTYKNSQTPDDIYYSTGTANGNSQASSSDYYNTDPSDQYVRMKVQDPARWSYFDDYYNYAFDPIMYNPYYSNIYGYGLGSPWLTFGYWSPWTCWNSYYAWNSIYNPYYGNVVVANPKVPSNNLYSHLRPFNPGGYANSKMVGRGYAGTAFNPYSQPGRSAAVTTNGSRGAYNGNSYYNSNQLYRSSGTPVRSYTPSSFGGNSSGFGGGGGGIRTGGGGGMSRGGR
jgi:hypothetical protein